MTFTSSHNGTCLQCGRVLPPGAACPNCARLYERATPGANTGRWLLLAGLIVLFSGLVFLVAPRGGVRQEPASAEPSSVAVASPAPVSEGEPTKDVQALANGSSHTAPVLAAAPVAPAPVPQSLTPPPTAVPPSLSSNRADTAFWRKKADRDLREAGEYVPTKDERAAWEAWRDQQALGLSDDARASDYYMRRPELRKGR